MQKLLLVAIASLSNSESRSPKWNIERHDSKWIPTAVVDVINTLLSLKSLELV